VAVLQRRPLVIGNDAVSQSEFYSVNRGKFYKWRPVKDIKYKNFSFRGLSNKKNYITPDLRDSTLTYSQKSIFSLTNHSAILCDTSVTWRQYFRHPQKVQTSQHWQRPTQYTHTGDFTMGAARSRPPAYYTGLAPGITSNEIHLSFYYIPDKLILKK